MKINSAPSFKATFCNTDSMKQVVEYAVKKGKFDKLNEARKSIESADWFTKLEMNCGFDEAVQKSFFEIIRFKPKYKYENGNVTTTYSRRTTRRYYPVKNPLKLAYEKIIKISNNQNRNNMYKTFVR